MSSAVERRVVDRELKNRRQTMSVLKQGFLVRKGRVRHTWKTRWFVLHEDRLSYYHKTDRSTPVGCLALEGASLVCPVPDYFKREAVFKLCNSEGKEYLLQAPSDVEREQWAHAISAVIRSMAVLSTTAMAVDSTAGASQISRARDTSLKLPKKVDLSEVLSAMQDVDAGLVLTSCEVDDAQYSSCFAGSSVIDWLLKWMFVQSREHGVQLTEKLLFLGHIQPIVSTVKKKSEVRPEIEAGKFCDSPDFFYRFSSLKCPSSEEFLDSGSDRSSSSEGEESDDDTELPGQGRGSVVKEGFLMKKGHDLRRKWKVRKVVLRDEPPTLEYYSASKMAKKPLKLVSLDGARILDLEQGTDPQENLLNTARKKQHILCIQKPAGRPIVLEAQDEYERVEWTKCLQKLLDTSPSSA